MARYWVGDSGERRPRTTDRSTVPDRPRAQVPAPRRESVTEAVRRTLAGNVTSDED